MLYGNIQYLHRHQIDTKKWDRCIDNARNCLVYGYSFYLDHMAKHWDALVLGDYEVVMPLVWNRKWGIKYLYQPAFTQQLGIFTNTTLTHTLEASFLNEVQKHFRYSEILLNYAHPGTDLVQRSNFILPLNRSYKELAGQYKQGLVKSLKRAKRYNLVYSDELDCTVILDAHKKLYGNRTPHVTEKDYSCFKELILSREQKSVIVRAVTENKKLLSAVLLLLIKNRLYLLESVTWPEGRKKEANHFLIDRLVHEFSGSDTLLDFEGSDLPGVSYFYKIFGSVNQPYFFYRVNKLPVLIRWLKQ
jgi:hypothetical protein